MAHTSLIMLPATLWVGDDDAQLVAGDVAANPRLLLGRSCWAMDDTNEMALVTPELIMPGQYAAGTLTATVAFFMASDVTNDVALDFFVEAKTLNTDTLDLEAASSWDTANSGTLSLSGTTAGDPLSFDITLTNKDSVAALDLVRFGIRRDCDSANDDAVGDLYFAGAEVWETT